MNKRKIILLAVALCMVAILAVGGTLAYFTDTDAAVNTFTVGQVEITLIEQERTAVGGDLVDFTDDKMLYPIVESVQTPDKDRYGLTKSDNYEDKIITVQVNKGSEDAYVRVLVAVPAELDNETNAGNNILHWNLGDKFDKSGSKTEAQANDLVEYNWDWKFETTVKLAATEEIIAGEYNVYSFLYTKPMTAEEITASACVVGFYLDKGVDYDHEEETYTINGEAFGYNLANGVSIPVFAQGVQVAGFDSAAAAFAAAELPVVPWTIAE